MVAVDRSIYGGEIASEVMSDNVQGDALAAIAPGRATNGNVAGSPGTSVARDRVSDSSKA